MKTLRQTSRTVQETKQCIYIWFGIRQFLCQKKRHNANIVKTVLVSEHEALYMHVTLCESDTQREDEFFGQISLL